MSEQMGVLCWSPVAGGGYTAGSGVLNVGSTSTGSGILPFPGSGTFSVVIADATTKAPKALLEVTGINSSTQFAVTNSGGVDVNCNAGDIVQAVIDKRALTAILAGSWVALAGLYQNGWTDLGGGEQVGQYNKDGTGRVWLRGTIQPGTTTAATAMFTLPAGFRPPGSGHFSAVTGSNIVQRIDITTAGVVQLGPVSDVTSYLVLDGISFSVN